MKMRRVQLAHVQSPRMCLHSRAWAMWCQVYKSAFFWQYAGSASLEGGEEQVRADDVLVAGQRRSPFVLVHPVRRKHEQPARPGAHRAAELGKARLSAFSDVVQVPEKHQIAIRFLVDGVEMQLELLGLARPVALHPKFRGHRRVGHRDRQTDVLVVALEAAINLVPEQGAKSGIRELPDVQLRPRRAVETGAHAPAISD